MIHCIGDSHAAFYSGKNQMQPIYPTPSDDILPYFKSYRIGPATAYQLNNKRPIIDHIVNNKHNSGDSLMFLFGEVDCRLHLGNNNNTEECVDRYIDVIKSYKQYNVVVCGAIASGPDHLVMVETPYIGNCIERNERTIKFNSLLEEKCDEYNILFVSVFDIMVFDDGNTNDEYLMDHIHLSQKSMPVMVRRLKDLGVIDG